MKPTIINRLVALERVKVPDGKVLYFIEQGPDDFIIDGNHINRTDLDAMPARKKVIYHVVGSDGNKC